MDGFSGVISHCSNMRGTVKVTLYRRGQRPMVLTGSYGEVRERLEQLEAVVPAMRVERIRVDHAP
jgi:hypothetical protein